MKNLFLLFFLLTTITGFTQNNCPSELALSNNISTGLYAAGDTIKASGAITTNSDVIFKAGEAICLQGDFTVEAGATFLATIEECVIDSGCVVYNYNDFTTADIGIWNFGWEGAYNGIIHEFWGNCDFNEPPGFLWLKGSHAKSTITSDKLPLGSYTSAELSFCLRTFVLEGDELLHIEYSNDGTSYCNYETFNFNADARDSAPQGTKTIVFDDIELTNRTRFRFRSESDNNDNFFIDNIEIQACGYKAVDECYADNYIWRNPCTNLLNDWADEQASQYSHFQQIDNMAGNLFNTESADNDAPDDGCFELINAFPNLYDVLKIGSNISVTSNTVYTLSVMMKTPQVSPSPALHMRVNFLDANENNLSAVDCEGNFKTLNNGGFYRAGETKNFYNSVSNEWEEQNLIFETPDSCEFIEIQFLSLLEYEDENGPINCATCDTNNEDCWPILIDHFYLGEGISFGEQPKPKVGYTSSATNIDELGNIEVFDNGAYKSFFPLMIYHTGYRNISNPSNTFYNQNDFYNQIYLNDPDDPSDDGYNLYGKMGFNMSAWGSYGPYGNEIADLLAGGLDFVNFDITSYSKEWASGFYWESTDLEPNYNALDPAIKDKILFAYHDNEVEIHQTQWYDLLSLARDIMDKPIYQLNGNPGTTANFNNEIDHLVDITGSYVNNQCSGFSNLTYPIFNHQNNIKVPGGIAQHTEFDPRAEIGGHDQNPRPIIYASIAAGAKGYGYYVDNPVSDIDGDGNFVYNETRDIRKAAWFDDFDNVACEVNNMLPIIRMPHWTKWKVTTNNEKIDFGTRQDEGYPYLFVANSSGQTQTVTFDLTDLEIPNASVRDYNYNTIVGSIINHSLTLTLPNDACQLLKIDALIPVHLLLPSTCLPSPITNFESCNPATYTGLQEMEQVEKLLKKIVSIEDRPNPQLIPNPFDSKVTFTANNLLGMVDIQVYNALGQLVYSKIGVESTSLEIQTDNWNDGIYIFNITYSNPDLRAEHKLETLRMINSTLSY